MSYRQDAEDSASGDSDLDENESPPYEDELIGGQGWGKKRRYFYGGNPNEAKRDGRDSDLSEMSEGEMEALESHKLQMKQIEELEEEDFLDAFAVEKVRADCANEADVFALVTGQLGCSCFRLTNRKGGT